MGASSHDQIASPQLRLLYIDDNPVNLRVVAELLQSVGASVTTAMSGAEGLSLLQVQSFDVVLTDIHMPEMSGFEVAIEVRRLPAPADAVPVIALTADTSLDAAQYRARGFDGFISKPVTLRPLLQTVLDALGARPRQALQRRTA